ncbi:unnamed protein product [Schistosoma turkestanicum]|nr:unnamed protein product [Schistosoma turkestanicum]
MSFTQMRIQSLSTQLYRCYKWQLSRKFSVYPSRCLYGHSINIRKVWSSNIIQPKQAFCSDSVTSAQSQLPSTITSDNSELSDDQDAIKGKMYIEFTCKKCSTRSIIIRCDGCQNLHLIADNLGWIKDNNWKIEDCVKVDKKSVCIA